MVAKLWLRGRVLLFRFREWKKFKELVIGNEHHHVLGGFNPHRVTPPSRVEYDFRFRHSSSQPNTIDHVVKRDG